MKKQKVQPDEKMLLKYGWKKEQDGIWIHKLNSKIVELKDEENPSKGTRKVNLEYHLECDYKNIWWLILVSKSKISKSIGDVKFKNCIDKNYVYEAHEPNGIEAYNMCIESLSKLKFIPHYEKSET